MAIKKALYGRQPGCFCLDFPSVLLLSQEIRFFVLILEFSIKSQVKPIWTYKLLSQCMKFLFQHESAHRMILRFLLVCRIELIFQYVLQLFVLCKHKNWLNFLTSLAQGKTFVLLLLLFWTDSAFFCFMHSLGLGIEFHDSFKQESEHTT